MSLTSMGSHWLCFLTSLWVGSQGQRGWCRVKEMSLLHPFPTQAACRPSLSCFPVPAFCWALRPRDGS